MTLSPLGDSAIVLTFGETVDDAVLARVQAAMAEIRARAFVGVVDVVGAFSSVIVYYEVGRGAEPERLAAELGTLFFKFETGREIPVRKVEIPVRYGGEFGPDLALVAAHANRTVAEVIALHRDAIYRVHAVGFVPGFAYLGGLPAAIHVPRRATPRVEVAAGSVGIGGGQTGVYPLATPGGWNLIGRTPLRLFDPSRAEPALLRPGDAVVFREIETADFVGYEAERRQKVDIGDDSPVPAGDERARVEVIKPGMLTTVQDLGRPDQRGNGVPVGGAADSFALRLANLLVGNVPNAAALEVTWVGPELRFPQETFVALAGAEFEGLPSHRPTRVEAGGSLRLGAARRGCRGYLAIAGGFEVPYVLGSRSTVLRAGFGGYEGRALREGDVLRAPKVRRELSGHWRVDERILPEYGLQPATLRVVRGAQAEEFDGAFFAGALRYKVSPQSDRMGVRLTGDPLLRRSVQELRSAAVVPGTVQVPPDGHPIVLLVDAQTLGGYPQVAHVISVDLPLAAQLRPGDAVRFVEVSLGEAHHLATARERALALLREGLALKIS